MVSFPEAVLGSVHRCNMDLRWPKRVLGPGKVPFAQASLVKPGEATRYNFHLARWGKILKLCHQLYGFAIDLLYVGQSQL